MELTKRLTKTAADRNKKKENIKLKVFTQFFCIYFGLFSFRYNDFYIYPLEKSTNDIMKGKERGEWDDSPLWELSSSISVFTSLAPGRAPSPLSLPSCFASSYHWKVQHLGFLPICPLRRGLGEKSGQPHLWEFTDERCLRMSVQPVWASSKFGCDGGLLHRQTNTALEAERALMGWPWKCLYFHPWDHQWEKK